MGFGCQRVNVMFPGEGIPDLYSEVVLVWLVAYDYGYTLLAIQPLYYRLVSHEIFGHHSTISLQVDIKDYSQNV